METQPLNLLIVDNNRQMIDTLSKYLKERFGMRMVVSPFFDVESCMMKIDSKSHVLVLDYLLGKRQNGDGEKKAEEIYNLIRQTNPNTKVTMITSREDVEKAEKEIQEEASNYVIQAAPSSKRLMRLLNRLTLSPAYSMVVTPLKVRVVMPIVKIISEYTLQDYLIMFIIAFTVVGSLVMLALKMLN